VGPPRDRRRRLIAAAIAIGAHALGLVLGLAGHPLFEARPHPAKADEPVIVLRVLPPAAEKKSAETERSARAPQPAPVVAPALIAPQERPVEAPQLTARPLASMAAPPAPTAEEWAFAARYTLKNSKGYRYSWGQQVRSLMGTAVEGPEQGMVRFRIEIAPDGTLARLQTLWSTSAAAEQRARQAIGNLPRLPPTPTGQPLVFDRTISFTPFASDGPPLYKDDCLPDPPEHGNPFAWDGTSTPARAVPKPAAVPDPQALEECLKQLPKDSIEAESARDQRLKEQWDSSRLQR